VGVEVWSRDRLIEAQEVLARVKGTTVLIHDQACAAEARRARKRNLAPTPPQRVAINHRICEGCGDCGEVSNCLSVQPIDTPFGRKTEIDQTTCNLDYSCLEGDCPSFMTITLREPNLLARFLAKGGAEKDAKAVPTPTDVLPVPEFIVPNDEFAMRITGIGGTGVVTVAQVVGTAAMLDGYTVRGLDQIGLSQKAGPVVSDLRLSRTQATATSRLGEGQADLLLAFDQLVAASEKGMLTAHPDRTTVVGSTAATPTGEMITHPEVELPTMADLAERIAGGTRSEAQFWADAASVTEDLFGNTTAANLFVVGMAFQAGCLPIAADRIEEAIRLNGVALEANLAAFRWGRLQIADPSRVDRARHGEIAERPIGAEIADSSRSASAGGAGTVNSLAPAIVARIERLAGEEELCADLTRMGSERVAWGGLRVLDEWLVFLERTSSIEERVRPGSRRLLRVVAENAYKLTAYKDEYEVARLMLDPEGTRAAREIAGRGGRLAWKLHPPLLRAFGLRGKISIGFWAAPLFRLLAAGRMLRGTPFDPFGGASVRRVERELARQYREVIDRVLERLSERNFAAVVEMAGLPDQVRGYEDLKLERVAAYRSALDAAEKDLPPS
jgi:indolepyruvate ferredoxin oxidoreductase